MKSPEFYNKSQVIGKMSDILVFAAKPFFLIPLPPVVDTEQLIITVYKKLGRFPDSSKAKENKLNGCITSRSPYRYTG